MDRATLARHDVAFLEILGVDRTVVDGLRVRNLAQLDRFETFRRVEIAGRSDPRGPLHELGPDWQRDARAVRVRADRGRLVEPDPHADDETSRKPEEPCVVIVVGRAGLAAHRYA